MSSPNPEPMGRTAPGYSPSADSARLAMTAGRLALEAHEAGVPEWLIYEALETLIQGAEVQKAAEEGFKDPDLMCDNEECEECYG